MSNQHEDWRTFDTPTVLLVRHGMTRLDQGAGGEKIAGWIDTPLNAQGQREADRLAKDVQAMRMPVSVVITSDLKRAAATAMKIGQLLKVRVHQSEALRSANMGHLQGRPVADVTDDLIDWVKHPTRSIDGAVPFAQYAPRVLRFVDEQMRAALRERGMRVLVTHGRVILMVKAWIANGMPADYRVNTRLMVKFETQPDTSDGLLLRFQDEAWDSEAWDE